MENVGFIGLGNMGAGMAAASPCLAELRRWVVGQQYTDTDTETDTVKGTDANTITNKNTNTNTDAEN